MNTPVDITVDADGTLYVPNSEENDVEEYRSGQNHLYQTITDDLDVPVAVTVSKKGWLYVVNLGNYSVI